MWWKGKHDDIENYVQSCIFCQQRKGSYMQRNKIPMKNLDHGSEPFSSISIDFVHMPSSKTGKNTLLQCVAIFQRQIS